MSKSGKNLSKENTPGHGRKRPAWQGGSRTSRDLHFTPGKDGLGINNKRKATGKKTPASALKRRSTTPARTKILRARKTPKAIRKEDIVDVCVKIAEIKKQIAAMKKNGVENANGVANGGGKLAMLAAIRAAKQKKKAAEGKAKAKASINVSMICKLVTKLNKSSW